LRGARIGVVRHYFGFHRGVDGVIAAALDVLRQQGAILVDPAPIPTLGQFDEDELTVMLYEFKAGINTYLARLGPLAPVHNMQEIIAFNENHHEQELRFFGQETMLRAVTMGPLSDKKYLAALAKCRKLSRQHGIDAVMTQHNLDALVAPTEGAAWVTDLINGDHFIGGSSTLAAVAGYPSITVPAGALFDLPLGLSFFGRAWSEGKLLTLAYSYEQASKHRRPPRFSPSINFPQ